jgi:hypothetical protein
MADAKEVINDARFKIKRIAAAMLVRKESLERELEAARGARPSEGSEPAALAARIADLEEALAVAEQDYRDALQQFDELARLGKDAERAELRALIDSAAPAPETPRTTSDEKAREQLEALKAARKGSASSGEKTDAGGTSDQDGDDDARTKGPKRTL